MKLIPKDYLREFLSFLLIIALHIDKIKKRHLWLFFGKLFLFVKENELFQEILSENELNEKLFTGFMKKMRFYFKHYPGDLENYSDFQLLDKFKF